MWRQVYCDEDTLNLKKWLDGVLEKYKTLQWFGIPRAQHPGVFGPREYDDEESESYKQVEELKRIYAQHGWPDRYNGDDCRQRLLEWAAKAKE
ncbi:hypothetical protein COL154_001598 [Colletotrichum chrysophilum]|nr:hypothetical protein COL154_001598 [Colletotrichum chrysophilum]